VLGDIVEESDGVNIAARLEGVAKPGAVCLSEQAYWQVKGRSTTPVTLSSRTSPNSGLPPGLSEANRRYSATWPPMNAEYLSEITRCASVRFASLPRRNSLTTGVLTGWSTCERNPLHPRRGRHPTVQRGDRHAYTVRHLVWRRPGYQ
jgi:hypothetical protein